jgi:hypothetical protein
LVGRWGWADPGDAEAGESMMGNGRYDLGERLGDLVLAAEQPFGHGKVIVFGDTSGFTNGLTIGCHEYTSRVYAYLADGRTSCQSPWRQWLGLLAALLLVAAVAWRSTAWHLAGVAIITSVALAVSTHVSHQAAEVLPDGREISPNKLAYIDVSHLNAASRESWRPDGLMGLCLTLMRNGYLTLKLREITEERVNRAHLLVSVAPTKAYSEREQKVILDFVRAGGIFICTVGYDDVGPLEPLLWKLGYLVGGDPAEWQANTGEPVPLGHFKAPFFRASDYTAFVRFHAAWPIACDDPRAVLISHYPPDKPLIILRRFGKGLVAVVGDTCFAMNKNLERESGEPFDGRRENADFWRWFLALLSEDEDQKWLPPPPEELEAEEETGAADGANSAGEDIEADPGEADPTNPLEDGAEPPVESETVLHGDEEASSQTDPEAAPDTDESADAATTDQPRPAENASPSLETAPATNLSPTMDDATPGDAKPAAGRNDQEAP